MTDKQNVLRVIQQLPETLTLAEIQREVGLLESLKRGQEDLASGRLVRHDELKKRLRSWTSQ